MDLYSFDTEDAGDGNGARLIVVCGPGERLYYFDDGTAFLDFVRAHPGEYFACNLEYDLGNVFRRVEDQVELRPLLRPHGMFAARFAGSEFLDTMAQWPASVAQMGKSIGLEKIDAKGNFINREYCARDAVIVRRFVERARAREAEYGLPVAYTAGSKCLKYFEHSHGLQFGRWGLTAELSDTLRAGYFGGRVECFRLGAVSGPVHCADINSAYPAAMARPLPGLSVGECDHGECTPVLAEVAVRVRAPSLPLKDGRGLLFPVGEWRGIYPCEELNYWGMRGAVKVARTFRQWCTAGELIDLSGPVRDLYARRASSTDPVEKLALKVALNSAYGKLGAGREFRRAIHYTRASSEQLVNPVSGCGFIVIEDSGKVPRYSRVHIAAVITARVRIMLAEMMRRVTEAGGEVVYCDTDAVHFRGAPAELFPESSALGEAKIEFTESKVFYAGLKLYSAGDGKKTAAKGCPARGMAATLEYIHGGRVTGRRPVRMTSPKAAGQVNRWVEYSRQIRGEYLKGIAGKDGKIFPLTIKSKFNKVYGAGE